ncbi:MAG TPA: tetratricopeptide repeat protein, partial [Chloroflexia bacterium]|nr:tetratricopeptide repeat protein [Chloroflexia bacterium]
MHTDAEGMTTFLFIVIADSIRNWEQHPTAMPEAVAQHEAIVRAALDAHGGSLFHTAGDTMIGAFPHAPDALAAAVAMQRAAQAATWPPALGCLPVRIALHTGTAELRDGVYHAEHTLNRLARLTAAGHPGQVLVSGPTADLVATALPLGVTLRALGRRRLRDLPEPEAILQMVCPGLRADFPPLLTLDPRPSNLPVPPTTLLGRDSAVAAVRACLRNPDVRLVTLTGPGGIGKTRLSLEAAAGLRDEYEHGVYFVVLAPVSDPTLVASTIAATLGVKESGGQALISTLQEHLAGLEMLLVLDNFEQIVAAGPLVADLLAAAPRLKVLLSSRILLDVPGEQQFAVPPLELPDVGQLPPLPTLRENPAVALFVQRACSVRPDFVLSAENAAAVAAICAGLDGLPLAIELAAARSKLFPPAAMLARLDQRLSLLTGGPRDRPLHQQTLRGAIDWSYQLLDPAEQAGFYRLAVFEGGCTVETATAVIAPANAEALAVADLLESLVKKSLLREEGAAGATRFSMLETIREYALERLAASGEQPAIARAHAAAFLTLAEGIAPLLQGPDQATWLDRLEADAPNLRAALRWAEAVGEAEWGLRLAGAVSRYWWTRGHQSEGQAVLSRLLALGAAVSPAVRAKALSGLGLLAASRGEYSAAAPPAEESLAIYRQLGDAQDIARALLSLAVVWTNMQEYGRAGEACQEAIPLLHSVGDTAGMAVAYNYLGHSARVVGDHTEAAWFYAESLSLARQAGDRRGEAQALISLGYIAQTEGDYARAAELAAESLTVATAIGEKNMMGWSLWNAGNAACAQDD